MRSISRILCIGVIALFPDVAALAQAPAVSPPHTEASRAAASAARAERAEARRRQAVAVAQRQGWPVRGVTPDQRVFELIELGPREQPLYYITMNVDAAISTGADLVRYTGPYHLSGTNLIVGVWDEGSVRTNHQEFISPGRVFAKDGAPFSNHGTHVGGTIAARGHTASAQGMAPAVTVHSYDWNSDLAEMTAAAAAEPDQADKIPVSNHSYGYITGWAWGNWSGTTRWHWWGVWPEREDRGFGQYSTHARDWDELCHEAPYFLPFKAAGNDRNDGMPGPGDRFYVWDNGWKLRLYNTDVDPHADQHKQGGFNTIAYVGTAKNIMTVGSVHDAVTAGARDLTKAGMTEYSNWGPTDDGRIKPDIVANGEWLYSPVASTASSYGTYRGTSMATPNAAGSALLLIEHFRNLFPGQDMRASTLKGLIIHTADALGSPGPDYVYGWGLMNTKAAADHITGHAEEPDSFRIVEALLTEGSIATYPVPWDGGSPIRATLCWTDPPGPAQTGLNVSTPVLVNDLDLRIIGPDATVYYPYVLDPSDYTTAAATGDNTRDNVEQVYLAAPETTGTYTVTVSHKGSLSGGMQAFSLLVDGGAPGPEPVLDSFSWDTVLSPQAAGAPFPVTLTARDASGAVCTNVPVTALSAQAVSLYASDPGPWAWGFPLYSYWEDARTQSIYRQSDLGPGPRQLTGLALDVLLAPPQTLRQWTIRMKHTSLDAYTDPILDGPDSGWTVVHQQDLTLSDTGWTWFSFDPPFEYNGTDNLVIDFSFDNEFWTAEGYVRVTEAPGQTVIAVADSEYGSPLDWSGMTSPTTYLADYVPDVLLREERPVGLSPYEATDFEHGVWSGWVTVGEEAAGVILRAEAGTARGESEPFDVASQLPLPPPAAVSASMGAFTDRVEVAWDMVTGATHYRVSRSGEPEGAGGWLDDWLPGTVYDDFTAEPGSNYYYRVQAAAGAGGEHASGMSDDAPGWRAMTQTIVFPALGDQVATGTVVLAATASSGLPVSFAVAAGPAVLAQGTNLSFLGAGTVSVAASQEGNAYWYPALPVTNTFLVSKAVPEIVWDDPEDLVYGTALGDTRLNAEASVPGAFVYDPPAGTVLAPGRDIPLHAHFSPDESALFHGATGTVAITVHPTITASAGARGTVEPEGVVMVPYGDRGEIVVEADEHWIIGELLVDAAPVPSAHGLALHTQRWESVTAPHTLSAAFTALTAAHGVPREWLAGLGYDGDWDAAARDDPDQDGYPNWKEFFADTDPLDSESFPPPVHIERGETALTVSIDPTSEERIYHILSRTTLENDTWDSLHSAPGTGGPWSHEIALPEEGPLYLRIKVAAP